ncbi:MAG: hypothetical protein HC923_04585 [Myxococcales bacterium]|nr:hypothetical protein [Myxococcales bacterium]
MVDELRSLRKLPYPSTLDQLPLPCGRALQFCRPPKAEALLEEMIRGPLDPDEKLPYWAELWPSSVGLVWAIDEGRLSVEKAESWVELGAGLGLVSVAIAQRGAMVTATDWIPDALVYAEENARLNQTTLATRVVDWRDPPADLRPNRVIASTSFTRAGMPPGSLDSWSDGVAPILKCGLQILGGATALRFSRGSLGGASSEMRSTCEDRTFRSSP